jgi:hypothetical protein
VVAQPLHSDQRLELQDPARNRAPPGQCISSPAAYLFATTRQREPAGMEKPPGGEPGGQSLRATPRRQAKMRSDRSRSRKASGIIYRHFERKGGNGTITVAPRARARRPKTFTTAERASRYSHALYKTALAA